VARPSELAAERQVVADQAAAAMSLDDALQNIDKAMQQKADKMKEQATQRRMLLKRPAASMGGEATDDNPLKIVLSNERSRSQFLVRIPGMPSKLFKYTASSADLVEQEAKAYIKEQCDAKGHSVPAKYQV
jgi:hypothetical protein